MSWYHHGVVSYFEVVLFSGPHRAKVLSTEHQLISIIDFHFIYFCELARAICIWNGNQNRRLFWLVPFLRTWRTSQKNGNESKCQQTMGKKPLICIFMAASPKLPYQLPSFCNLNFGDDGTELDGVLFLFGPSPSPPPREWLREYSLHPESDGPSRR